MEIRHLKYFIKVAEELNFSRAAEKLFISQPPLSRQIKELEDELGSRLFNRSNKKVELTNAGKYFKHEADLILMQLEKAAIQTKKISDNISGEFRIAYISSTFSGTVSNLLKHLSKKYPFVNFKLYEVGTVKQIAALEQGKIDLGILRAPVNSLKIKTQLWFNDGYALVYNKNQFTLSNDGDLINLCKATFVFFNKDYAPNYYNSLIEICTSYGFTPNVVHESNNINSIIQLVSNGLGVSIVPASMSENYKNENIGFIILEKIRLFTEVLFATPINTHSEITDKAIEFLTNSETQ